MTSTQLNNGTISLLKKAGWNEFYSTLTNPETYKPLMNANWSGPMHGAMIGGSLGLAKNFMSEEPFSLSNALKDSAIGAGIGGTAGSFTNFKDSTYQAIAKPVMNMTLGSGLGRSAGGILAPGDNKKQKRLANLGAMTGGVLGMQRN